MKFVTEQQNLVQYLFLLIYIIAIISMIGYLALPALGTCIYEGQTYQTGDRVGPYVCMPDGSWQPQ